MPGPRGIILQDGGMTVPLAPLTARVLAGQPRERLARLGLSLVVEPSERATLRLVSSNLVGAGRFSLDGEEVDVRVVPKIGDASVMRMLTEIEGSPALLDRTTLGIGETLNEHFVLYAAESLAAFAERPRYHDYVRREEEYLRTPRGRPLVGAVARHCAPRLQWTRIPCTYTERSSNVLENRILMTAIERLARIKAEVAPGVIARVNALLGQARRRLDGVDVVADPLQALRRVRYDRRNRHFVDIHRLCTSIFERSSVEVGAEGSIHFRGLAIDMAHLFERWVRHALTRACDESSHQRSLTYGIDGTGMSLRLDGLYRPDGDALVLECKYRFVQHPNGALDPSRLRTQHLFQAVAYSSHGQIRARRAFLVYPGTGVDRPVTPVLRTDVFLGADGPLALHVLLVDLASPIERVEAALRDLLNSQPR